MVSHFPKWGGDTMVTYENMFMFAMVIIGIITYYNNKK